MDPKRLKTQHVYQSRFPPCFSETQPNQKKIKTGANPYPSFQPTGAGMTSSNQGDTEAKEKQLLGTKKMIDRTQFVRLLEQTLSDLGHGEVAKELEKASGIMCESGLVGEFRGAVLAGEWQKAVETLRLLRTEGENYTQALRLIYQHQYVEAVQKKDWDCALQCLRQRLSQLDIGYEQAKKLSMLCLGQPISTGELQQAIGQQGTDRQELLRKLQALIPNDQMLPPRRLEILLEQALDQQLSRGLLKDPSQRTVSLLEDVDGVIQLPKETIKVLADHNEQVWHVEFSHKGEMFASASCDGVLLIYEVQGYNFNLLHRLQHATFPGQGQGQAPNSSANSRGGSSLHAPHEAPPFSLQNQTPRQLQQQLSQQGRQQQQNSPMFHCRPLAITAISWSPDDRFLLSGGVNYAIRVWNPVEGQLLHTLMGHTQWIQAIAWVTPETFLSASYERKMVLWNLREGRSVREWSRRRGQDMVVTPDGRYCLYADGKKLGVMDLTLEGDRDIAETKFRELILSVTMSSDGFYLLVFLRNKELFLYRLNYESAKLLGPEPLKELLMPRQPPEECDSVIRQRFGGVGEGYVASGSLENKVYLWDVTSADFIDGLEGHSDQVNDVSWHPDNPLMLASGSDDKTVRIWGLEEHVQQWRLRTMERENEDQVMNGST